MSILLTSPLDEQRAAALRRMKILATSLLAVMAVIFGAIMRGAVPCRRPSTCSAMTCCTCSGSMAPAVMNTACDGW